MEQRRSNSEPLDKNSKSLLFLKGHKSIQWENKFIWLTPNFKKLFDINVKISKFYHFYQGLHYELGLNQFPRNYQKAFAIYQYQAQNSNDVYSLYHIYELLLQQKDPANFPLTWYCLFKSFAFMDYSDIKNRSFIYEEVERLFNYKEFTKAQFNLLLHKFKTIESPIFKQKDLLIINDVISYFFFNTNTNFTNLQNESFCNNDEATYKLACLLESEGKEEEIVKKLFEKLRNNKFYKSYSYYGDLLFEKYNEKEKAFRIFREGSVNGATKCYQKFYYSSLHLIKFEEIIGKKTKIEEKYRKLCFLIDILMNCYSIGHIRNCLDIIFLIKLGCKYCEFKDRLRAKYDKYINEILKFIIDNKDNETIISSTFGNNTYVYLLFTLGIAYYFNLSSTIKQNLEKAFNIFNEIYLRVEDMSFKVMISSFLYKIMKKEKLNSKERSNNNLEKYIYDLHINYLNNTSMNNLDASFFYSLAQLNEKGIGTSVNNISAYIYYLKASQYTNNKLETYFMNNYRKYKSLQKMKLKKFIEIEEKLNKMKFSEIKKNEDEIDCIICFDNVKQIVMAPCLHKLCNKCYEHIKEKEKCPICRGKIICSYTIKKA